MKRMEEIVSYFESVHMKQATLQLLDTAHRSPDACPFPPQQTERYGAVSHRICDHRPVFTIRPEQPVMRLLYLHGGAFYNDFAPAHWRLMGKLAETLRAEVVTPDYPLTPIFGHRDVMHMLRQVYRDCLEDLPGGRLVLAGDSAGGNLALALCQWARDLGLSLPRRLALLSPWLDLSMSSPRLAELDAVDPFLEPVSGARIAAWYAQGSALTDPSVSPLFGDMAGLPPTLIFTGTRDILNDDARRADAALRSAGTACRLHEAEGMIHTWMLFPVEEAVQPLSELTAFLRE